MYSRCGVSVFATLENLQSQWGIPAAPTATDTREPDASATNHINLQDENDHIEGNAQEDELLSLNGL